MTVPVSMCRVTQKPSCSVDGKLHNNAPHRKCLRKRQLPASACLFSLESGVALSRTMLRTTPASTISQTPTTHYTNTWVNPSGPTRVFTDHFTDHFYFYFFCLARSSRVGDLKKNTRTPHARSCTASQSNAVPAKGQQKTLKSKIYKRVKSFH